MIKLVKEFLVAIALLMVGMVGLAEARPGHGGGGTFTNAPVLQAVADSFGSETPSGLGGVFLNSQDLNYGTGFNPKGLDLLVSGTCTKYSTSVIGGTASHWNVISHTVAALAKTPTPTATGVGAHLNGGPYTFLVSCEDTSNNILASTTLTRVIRTNAVNFGTGDRNFSNWPGTFGTVAGATFMFSTGFVYNAGSALGLTFGPFTNNVNITWADTSRPGSLSLFLTGAGSANVTLKDLTLTGSVLNANGNVIVLAGNGTAPMNMDNVHAYYKSTTTNLGTLQFLSAGNGTAGGTINNVSCEWCATGMSPPSHYIITNVYFRYFQNNCFFLNNGSHDYELDDYTCASPQGNPAFHQDSMQMADASTPHDIIMKRGLMIQADGNNTTQGNYFGGFVMGGITAAPLVYLSSGVGVTTPGKVMTFVTGSLGTGANGSTFYSSDPGAHAALVGLADNATLSCAGGNNCGGETTATVNIASNVSLGSPSSPVPIYGKQAYNVNIDQYAYIGYTINGLRTASSGDNWNLSNFAYVYTQYATQASLGGTVQGQIDACDINEVHTGTSTFSGGFFWKTLGYSKQGGLTGCASPPPNTTVSNVLLGNDTPATITPWFLNGNPQTVPQNISFATYAAMSINDLKALACNDLQAAPGSAYDGHSPFISGGWKDGTPIVGCN